MRFTIGRADILYVLGVVLLLLYGTLRLPNRRVEVVVILIFAFALGVAVNHLRKRFGYGKLYEFTMIEFPYRFSLSALLILVTAVSIILGLIIVLAQGNQ